MQKRYSPKIERNLLACYYRANTVDIHEGLNWYSNAHLLAIKFADEYNLSIQQSCGVIAALSPGTRWEVNIRDAETLISEYHLKGLRGRKLSTVGVYGRKNTIKAINILDGIEPLDVLGGNKVRSFYANILNPNDSSHVTVDRHAKCCALGLKSEQNSLVRNSEYEYLSEHFRRASRKVNLNVCDFQAICWVTWRRLNGVLAQYDLYSDVNEVPF
jgi:hypothetical protein